MLGLVLPFPHGPPYCFWLFHATTRSRFRCFFKKLFLSPTVSALGICCAASMMIRIYGNNFVRILLEYFSAMSVVTATCVATATCVVTPYCTCYGPDKEHVNYFHLFTSFQTQEP